jgi:hypothetical protein
LLISAAPPASPSKRSMPSAWTDAYSSWYKKQPGRAARTLMHAAAVGLLSFGVHPLNGVM